MTILVLIVTSSVLGFLLAILLRFILTNRRDKIGLHEVQYKSIKLSSKMKVILREIVFNFSIRRFNRDFLLNIKSGESILIQVMHRAHFPDFCKDTSDIKFGFAIYIPTKPVTAEQRQKLLMVLKEEMENFDTRDVPVEFFVIDAGSRVKFNGYLLARIIKEVFGKADVGYELYDEGILPYHYYIDVPKGTSGLN